MVYCFVLNKIHTEQAARWKGAVQVNLLSLRVYILEKNKILSPIHLTLPHSPCFPSLLSNPNTLNVQEKEGENKGE